MRGSDRPACSVSEGLVLERKALRGSGHARRCAYGTLRTHERRRFHRSYVTAGGLVGAGASPNIQYRPRIAKRSPNPAISLHNPFHRLACRFSLGPPGLASRPLA
jgi:hypothetical protein